MEVGVPMKRRIKEKMHRKWKKDSKRLFIGFSLIICIVLGGMFSFLKLYRTYIDRILYAERLNQMKEVTIQLFSGLEDVVKNEWREAENQSLHITYYKPKNLKQMIAIMQRERKLNQFDKNDTNIIAVDDRGNYYTQTGQKGLLSERESLLSQPERANFVSSLLLSDDTRMLYLKKLSQPLLLQEKGKKIVIKYYGISQSMAQLNPYFECSAYDNNNSMYIVDSDGLKLFTSGKTLLKGYNVYSALSDLEYLHGSSYDIAKKCLEKNNISYSNAVLDGKEIYYAFYHMKYAKWTLVFMVPSEYVATNTVKLINMSIQLVLAFAIVLIAISGTLIFVILKREQKVTLEAERKNNEVLEALNKDLEKAVEVADAANKAKGDFLANMSHDIRTPMNAIVGITNLMEHEKGISDKQQDYIQKVQLSSRHLLGLINDILDMSKIESSEVNLTMEAVNLAEQIDQIDNIIRAQANERKQDFHIQVKEIVHEYVICDGVRLRQVLLNLLSNAVKYTPDGGNISLDFAELTSNRSDYAKFKYTVTDNGYGMSEEFVKHIFEPFTRAENSITNKVQGTGLGMAITKNIVDLMGGEIKVESQLGKGSCFEVILSFPINKDADYQIGVQKILLLTKDELLLKNITAALKASGIKLYRAKTKQEATSFIERESIDVILLSGCRDCENLQKNINSFRKLAQNKPFIFCLDDMGEERKQDILNRCEVDGVILRPFFFSNLANLIAKIRTNDTSEENDSLLRGMKFLCAEDNELNAEILYQVLEMYGASCTIYPDGEKIVEAFENIKPGEYQAILMDVQMPKMNGFEATKMIRNSKNPLGSEIPIIAMTANAFSEDVKHCLESGMNAHIAKPIDIMMLEKTLRKFSVRMDTMKTIQRKQ